MLIYNDGYYLTVEVDIIDFNEIVEHLIEINGNTKVLLGNSIERNYLESILDVNLEDVDYYKIKLGT